jgi:hypothetical protein
MSDSILNHPQFNDIATSLELDRGLPLGSLKAVALQESGGRADANSGKAYGLMQFTPATAKQYNVDVSNPWDSLRGGADFLSDLQNKYGDNFQAALAHYNGGTSQGNLVAAGQAPTFDETRNYVTQVGNKMQKTAPSQDQLVSVIENSVANMKANGYSDVHILTSLLKSPVADVVQSAQDAGFSPSDIVSRMGGQALQKVTQAQAKVASDGVGTTLVNTLGDVGGDLANASKQLSARAMGRDEDLAKYQQEQAAAQADPERMARGDTATGMITKGVATAAPYIAAAALAPEALIPQVLAGGGVGATQGAFTPTTGDGQFAANVGWGTLAGGGGAAAGGLLGKGIGRALGADTGAQADVAAQLAAASKNGLPARVMDVSPTVKNLVSGMDNATLRVSNETVDKALTGQIAQKLGVQGWDGAIDHNLINAAEPAIKQAFNDATNVSVVLPQTLGADLAKLATANANPLTDGIATSPTVTKAIANLTSAAESGVPVNGTQLQALNSELKAVAMNQGASATERTMARDMIGKVDSTLKAAMTPEQQTAYEAANDQWKHLIAVKDMVARSNDSGVVNPRQILQAAKKGGFKNAFLHGDAPFQELGSTASDLYGPANGQGLANILGKALGVADHVSPMAIAIEPARAIPAYAIKMLAGGLLSKAATSTNPALIRALSGAGPGLNDVTKAYIAKALSGMGAASAT